MNVPNENPPPEVSPARASLLLADGHPLMLRGMEQLFADEADLRVDACCTTDAALLAAAAQLVPHVAVVDFRLPSRGGLGAVRRLKERQFSGRVVLVADRISEMEMTEAVRLGVRGIVLKDMAPRFFVQCVRQVHAGSIWIENGCFGRAVERMARVTDSLLDGRRRLTPREVSVVRLVAQGLRNREIMTRLSITEGTVKIHLHNIYEKLGTNDRTQLALRARDEGLV